MQAVPTHLNKMRIELCPCSHGEDAVGRSVTFVLIDQTWDADGVECVGDREDTSLNRNEGGS